MTISFLKNIFLLVTIIFSVESFAQTIELGRVAVGGTGCSHGQASATLSPDKTKIIIQLDTIEAQASTKLEKTLDRKNCSIAIPLSIPTGLSIGILSSETQGTVSLLSKKASAQINLDAFLAGDLSTPASKKINGVRRAKFSLKSELDASILSTCGSDKILRINSSLLIKNPTSRLAKVSLGSNSALAIIIVNLKTALCE